MLTIESTFSEKFGVKVTDTQKKNEIQIQDLLYVFKLNRIRVWKQNK
jgi:hypothetical protein